MWIKERRDFTFMTSGLKRERKKVRNDEGPDHKGPWVLAAWLKGLLHFIS